MRNTLSSYNKSSYKAVGRSIESYTKSSYKAVAPVALLALAARCRLRDDTGAFAYTFSIRACHPFAGAMLTVSASFQVQRMIPEGNPATTQYT